jgi:hypothetical protein
MMVTLDLVQPIKYADPTSRLPLPRSKLTPLTQANPARFTFYNHNNTPTPPSPLHSKSITVMTSGPPSTQDQDALIAELVGLTGLSTTEVSSTECHGTL